MSDTSRGGPLSEDPEFHLVSEIAIYPWTTDGPILYTPIYVRDQPVAYLWAAPDNTAAGVAYGPGGGNAAVGWSQRLKWAFANKLSPTQALRHWAGKPLDPTDERSGVIHADEEHELASLAELEQLAAS